MKDKEEKNIEELKKKIKILRSDVKQEHITDYKNLVHLINIVHEETETNHHMIIALFLLMIVMFACVLLKIN